MQSHLQRREVITNTKSLDGADWAYRNGDIETATLIYTKVALSRPKTNLTDTALKRLEYLRREARQKLSDIDELLESNDTIVEAFDKYEALIEKYRLVPMLEQELRKHVASLRSQPEYAAVLNEDRAKELWVAGQEHESRDEICCAILVYEEAERLLPAASAKVAKDRIAVLKRNPDIEESVQTCRDIRWCHATFRRAEHIAKIRPTKAKELFAEIVARAPEDTEVHRAAQEYLRSLGDS